MCMAPGFLSPTFKEQVVLCLIQNLKPPHSVHVGRGLHRGNLGWTRSSHDSESPRQTWEVGAWFPLVSPRHNHFTQSYKPTPGGKARARSVSSHSHTELRAVTVKWQLLFLRSMATLGSSAPCEICCPPGPSCWTVSHSPGTQLPLRGCSGPQQIAGTSQLGCRDGVFIPVTRPLVNGPSATSDST